MNAHGKRARGLLMTAGIFYALLVVYPFYILVINSLKTNKAFFTNALSFPANPVFANYAKALDKMNFFPSGLDNWGTFGNSLFITVGSLLLILVCSSMAAWVLARGQSKIGSFIFYMFVASMLIPFQVVLFPIIKIAGYLNILNTFRGMIFIYLGFGSSLSLFMFHGFIKTVPLSLEEAATIDGCSRPGIFWRIVFPLLKPITASVAILNSIWIWNDYLLPSVILQQREKRTIPIQISYFFGQFASQMPLAMSALMVAILPIIIFYLIMQKQIIKGVTAGGVKF